MIVEQMNWILRDSNGSSLHFMLPSGDFIPPHFHVTDVGRVQKAFVANRCRASCNSGRRGTSIAGFSPKSCPRS
jgi:hypothetical protein